MVQIKFIDVIGFRTEDPKYPTSNLLKGGKWLSEKKRGNSVNEVTLRLDKVHEISAIDVGNSGTAFISIEVSRIGLQRFETLLPSTSLMSANDCKTRKNWLCVKMLTAEDFSPSTRDQKWDIMRITCLQPFLVDVQFGFTFIKAFAHLTRVLEQIDGPSCSRNLLRTSQPDTIKGISLPISRSEKIVQEVKGRLQTHSEDSVIASGKMQCNGAVSERSDAKKNDNISFQENLLRFRDRLLSDPLWNSPKYSDNVAKKKKYLQIPSSNSLKNSTKPCNIVCKRECSSDSDSDSTVIVTSQEVSKKRTHVVLVHSPKSVPSSSGGILRKKRKGTQSSKQCNSDNVDAILPASLSPKSISSEVTDIILLEDSDSTVDAPREQECPLCLEKFEVSKIEEHAANCCIVVESEPITTCPICGNHFPPKVLEQHADLCADRM